MRTCGLAGAFLAALLLTAAAPADDRAQLLEGVHEIAAPGAPGALAVFKNTAAVVVAGKSDGGVQTAVVAVAPFGRGRIVAFGHDGYFNKEALDVLDTGRLVQNTAHWAAHGRDAPKVGLVGLADLGKYLQKSGLTTTEVKLDGDHGRFDVLALQPTNLSATQIKRVRAFVKGGGGLLVAVTGWGWQQGSGLPMPDLAGNKLLDGSGLAWTSGFAERTTQAGFRADAEVSPLINAGRALDAIASHSTRSRAEAAQASASILLALRSLPADETPFRGELAKVLRDGEMAGTVPSEKSPVRASDVLPRLALAAETESAQSARAEAVRPLSAANDFPGSVPGDAERVTRTVEIDTGVPGWHSLGLYAAPGERITVTVPGPVTPRQLAVRIGAHTDELWHLDSWKRSPSISRAFPIHAIKTVAANAFGGLIYIDVHEGAHPRKLAVKVTGAVEAPLFQRGETTADAWRDSIRQRPAPWAELAGHNLVWTVPSSLVRSLDDPEALLTLWDSVVAAQDEFVSLPKRTRPERIVVDRQIAAGYMHSGYPIMAPIDDSAALALDLRRLRAKGSWGHFHELGHNHQSGDWTFEGTGEVTNNVMVLYVFDTVLKLPYDCGHEAIRDRPARTRKVREFQSKGAPFDDWKRDPFLALMMYMQLYDAFGWQPFRAVFAEYRTLPHSDRPHSDSSKRDQWLTRFSRTVGKNLGPFFQSWGVPTTDAARASLQDLPAWTPPASSDPRP